MAKTKEEKVEVLQKAGVKLTGDEKVPELDKLIKAHLNVDADETLEEPDLKKPTAKKRGSEEIEFHLTDGTKRKFSSKDHGDDFADVADEFHETNKKRIHRRLDDGKEAANGDSSDE